MIPGHPPLIHEDKTEEGGGSCELKEGIVLQQQLLQCSDVGLQPVAALLARSVEVKLTACSQ